MGRVVRGEGLPPGDPRAGRTVNDLPKDRFRWTENAIAVWDNRCALHHALWDYWPHDRRGHRISVVGERPLLWSLDDDCVPDGSAGNVVRLTA